MGTPMISFKIQKSRQQINDLGGLSLISDLIKTNSIRTFSPFAKTRFDRIKDSDIILSYIALLCQGRTAYADIERIKNSKFVRKIMGIHRIPSQELLRQRIDALALNKDIVEELFQYNEEFLKKCTFVPTELPKGEKCIVLDIDVSPFDNSRSKKENVSCT